MRDQSEHNQYWPVGVCILRGEQQGAQRVEDVLMPTSTPWWPPNPKTGLPTSHSLLAAHHTAKEGWLVDHLALSGGIWAEELPSPEGFSWNQWLLGGEEGGNNHTGCGSPELHSPIRNAPRSTMWSDAGTLPVSCPIFEGDSLLNLEISDVAEKDPVASVPASTSAFLLQSHKRKNRLPYCWLRSHVPQSQRKLPIQKEDQTSYGEDFHQYHWGKHQASLIIKQSDFTQHQDNPVPIHPAVFWGGSDTSSIW